MTQDNQEKSTTPLIQPNQKKFLILLSVALLGIIAVIMLVEMEFSSSPPAAVTVSPKPDKVKAPEVALKAVVTDCDMITKSVDRTGAITEQHSDYRRLAGYVENRGEVTVKFVRVQAIYRNKDDKIIQVDEIFAVGDTPLHPGERVRFEDSKRNYLIHKCGAKILDWWVVSAEENEG